MIFFTVMNHQKTLNAVFILENQQVDHEVNSKVAERTLPQEEIQPARDPTEDSAKPRIGTTTSIDNPESKNTNRKILRLFKKARGKQQHHRYQKLRQRKKLHLVRRKNVPVRSLINEYNRICSDDELRLIDALSRKVAGEMT